MPDTSDADWPRLGELLVRRRIELDSRYANRQTFVNERGLTYRTVSDIERGRRSNYEHDTLLAVEVAYAVRPGSVAAALAGGELEPAPSAASDSGRLVPPAPGVLPPGYREPENDLASYLFAGDPVKRLAWRASRRQTDEERLKLLLEIDSQRRGESGSPDATREHDDGGYSALALCRSRADNVCVTHRCTGNPT